MRVLFPVVTLEARLICIPLSVSRDVLFDKRMICFLSFTVNLFIKAYHRIMHKGLNTHTHIGLNTHTHTHTHTHKSPWHWHDMLYFVVLAVMCYSQTLHLIIIINVDTGYAPVSAIIITLSLSGNHQNHFVYLEPVVNYWRKIYQHLDCDIPLKNYPIRVGRRSKQLKIKWVAQVNDTLLVARLELTTFRL